MMAIRVLFLALLLVGRACACINASGTDIHGDSAQGFFFPAASIRQAMAASPEEKIRVLDRKRNDKDGDEFAAREFEGLKHVYRERFDEALGIFEGLEAERPGLYSTAANLGTVYELKGDPDLALKWITEGITRNPDSHQGTEWLHAAILKAKIRLRLEPDFFNRNHIIPLPTDLSRTTRIKIEGRDFSTHEVRKALGYQLLERAFFVKPEDPVMADLLYTYGVLDAHLNVVESGIPLLQLSRQYGYHDKKELDEIVRHYESLIFFRKLWFGVKIGLGAVALVVFLIFAYRKKWFFLTRSAYRKHHSKIYLQRTGTVS